MHHRRDVRDLRCLRDQHITARLEPATTSPPARSPLITTAASALLIAIVVVGAGALFTAIATANTPSCACEVDHGHLR